MSQENVLWTNQSGAPQQPSFQAKTLKKPMKIGWIISLGLLVITIISIVVGGVMISTNNLNDTINQVDEKVVESVRYGKQNGFIAASAASTSDNSFTYTGLTPSRAYIFIVWQIEGEPIRKIKVNGNEQAAIYSDQNKVEKFKNFVTINRQYYFIIAKGSEMKITLDQSINPNDTSGRCTLLESQELTSRVEIYSFGWLIIFIAGGMSIILGISFLIFLSIYLVKNNKYKRVSQM